MISSHKYVKEHHSNSGRIEVNYNFVGLRFRVNSLKNIMSIRNAHYLEIRKKSTTAKVEINDGSIQLLIVSLVPTGEFIDKKEVHRIKKKEYSTKKNTMSSRTFIEIKLRDAFEK